MKRKTKNIISICLIILLCCVIIFTVLQVRNSNTNTNSTNQMSGMMNPNGNMESPPEKPDGNNEMIDKNDSPSQDNDNITNQNDNGNTPPELPNGNNGGTPPDMPNDNNRQNSNMPNDMNNANSNSSYIYIVLFGIESLILSCILGYLIMSGFNKKGLKEAFISSDKKIIYILTIVILTTGFTFGVNTISNSLTNNNQNNMKVQNNGNTSNITYYGKNEIKESTKISSGEYTSSSVDENAILVSGDIDVTLSDITVDKTGDSDGGDNTSFYGTNSGIIAKDGANLTLKNITVETNATGANGVFSYGGSATTNNSNSDGTTINISDSKITTTKDNSGGIMTTGGGIMNASNLNITTSGISSAAIRTDRGGGTVIVDGGTYKTTGAGSPTVYSTADVTVKNADLIATTSEGIVIEGKNKVSLENVNLTDTNNKLNGQSTTYKNIFLYQSMSGDASVGISEFSSTDSTITTNKGDTLYVTNTSSKINLTNNKIVNNDNTGNFLRVQKDSWGNSGANGGSVTLIMSKQEAIGNIVIDSISILDMTMEESSYYEGTINGYKLYVNGKAIN